VLKVNHSQFSLEIEFSAEFKNVDHILSIVKKFLDRYQENIDFFQLFLALREALNNAIVHGAGCDSSLSIKCNVELEDRKVIFFIEDPGSGFDWNKLLEQTDIDKNKETARYASTHGWGLFLLKKCCTGIKYYGTGNKLSFWFNLDNKV
jgi:serine/threonine-protein kinase RsbW